MSVRPNQGLPSTADSIKNSTLRTNIDTARAVWVALMLLTGLIVASGAGWLAYAGGANPPMALLTAGGTFAGAVLLMLALAQFMIATR